MSLYFSYTKEEMDLEIQRVAIIMIIMIIMYVIIIIITLYFSYTKEEMDLEIQRVARELYKALSGMNEEFDEVREDDFF